MTMRPRWIASSLSLLAMTNGEALTWTTPSSACSPPCSGRASSESPRLPRWHTPGVYNVRYYTVRPLSVWQLYGDGAGVSRIQRHALENGEDKQKVASPGRPMNLPLAHLGGPPAPNNAQPTPDALHAEVIRIQLECILGSAQFRELLRQTRFLSFVVATTLAGKSEFIKAYTIATQALSRDGDFDPQNDPIVRVEAGRLRHALARYYAQDGRGRGRSRTLPCTISSIRPGATISEPLSAGICLKARWPTASRLTSRRPPRIRNNSGRSCDQTRLSNAPCPGIFLPVECSRSRGAGNGAIFRARAFR
jgi:hypothetical protein